MDVSSLNAYSDYYSQLAKSQNAASVTDKLNGVDTSKATDDELMDVCKQFESYLVEQMFKNMEKTAKVFSDDEDSSNSQLVDFFKDQTIEKLASQSTDQNSLGLAQMLYDQLKINMGISPNQLAQAAAESGTVNTATEE